jgi:short-subunit dehydrogenase
LNIQDKVVLITGASSGIGALMAETFAAQGAVPVLTARSLPKLQEIAARIPGKHAVYTLDVTDFGQVTETVQQIMAQFGRIDILVNNAGFGIFETFTDAPLEHFEEMMDVNYMGIVRCTKAVLPHMLQAGSGHIVNIASMAGKIASAKSSGYSATKHAVLGFTNSLRQELVGTGVSLSAINPGPINTPFFERADPEGTYVKNIGWFMLQPEKVVSAVLTAIERKRAETNLPTIAGFGIKLAQLFPRSFDWIAYRMLNKK